MLDKFFGTEHIEIEFIGSVDGAIEKLDAQVLASESALAGQDESMVGSVSEHSTYVYRLVAGTRNSFRPTFYGHFVNDSDRPRLTGEITLNRVIKKFIVFWCAIVALVAVWTLITVLRNPAASWGSLVYIVVMLGLCIWFFRTMIRKNLPDKEWLQRELGKALN